MPKLLRGHASEDVRTMWALTKARTWPPHCFMEITNKTCRVLSHPGYSKGRFPQPCFQVAVWMRGPLECGSP